MPPVETPGFSLDPRLAADSEAVARIGLCELRLMNDRRWPWVLLVPQRAGIAKVSFITEPPARGG